MESNTPRTSPIRFRLPMAVQLSLGFILMIFLPTTVVALILLGSSQDVERRSLEAFLEQTGETQRTRLETTFEQAENAAANFVRNSDANRQLVGLLLRDVQTNPSISVSNRDEVEILIRTQFLEPEANIFSDVRILDRNGIVRAAVGSQYPSFADVGDVQDESQSTEFRAFRNAQVDDADLDRLWVVTERGQVDVQLMTTIPLRGTNNVVGYLIATIAKREALLNPLTFVESDVYPAYSFLMDDDNTIISLPTVMGQAELSRQTSAVIQHRQQGIEDFSYYTIEGGEEVGGYVVRIGNTPFILITQVPTAEVLIGSTEAFEGSLFVLVIGGIGLALVVGVVFYSGILYVPPLRQLERAIQKAGVGEYNEPIPSINRPDEIGDVSRSFHELRQRSQEIVQALQTEIDNLNRDIATTREISRVTVNEVDLQPLMDTAVDLIVKRFENVYHAQIFLTDSDNQYALLRASTGRIGADLLTRGHRLPVGGKSVVGQSTQYGEIVFARDTTTDPLHRPNVLLPDTRAELAVPFLLGNRVTGALDVQSKAAQPFTDDELQVFRTMADQLAIAIENSRLQSESEQRQQIIEQQAQQRTVMEWREYMYDQRTERIVRQAGVPTDLDLETLQARAIQRRALVIGEKTERNTIPLAIPLIVRQRVLGVAVWELPARDFDHNKRQLAEELAARLVVSLDNARLLEQTQRATQRERLVNDISAKLTAETDINQILQTAVREVGQALRAPQVSIRLSNSLGSSEPPPSETEQSLSTD